MLNRIFFVLMATLAAFLGHMTGLKNESFFFIYLVFLMIPLLYALGDTDRFFILFVVLIYVVYLVLIWFEVKHVYFFVSQLAVCIVLFLWREILHKQQEMILAVRFRQRAIEEDIEVLREKYKARLDSLTHLESQAASLLELFETAKDFNECLYFEQLLDILSKRIREQVPFHALTLTVLMPQTTRQELAVKAMSIGKSGRENLVVRNAHPMEELCLSEAKKRKKVIRYASENELFDLRTQDEKLTLPLWVFPLHVEDKMIAALTIEGAVEEDYPKYELLAAQLALQVKKISLYETVKELSIVDGLTKVYVRRYLMERLQEEIQRAAKRDAVLSVLMLDIDHFKSYNDKFGHLVGNGTLREVASLVRDHVRKVDFVARFGGEEFVVVMPGLGYPLCLEAAERIRSAVARKKFRLYDVETQVTVSIGVACFPSDLEQAKEGNEGYFAQALIEKSDRALYRAKEEGRNRVVGFHQIET